jgi:copper transport protein
VRNIRFSSGGTRSALALFLACTLLLTRWSIASAHAALVSAEPAANSHLAASPSRVRLLFSEPLEPTLAHISVVSSDSHFERLTVAVDPHDVHALIAPVRPLAPGAYRVVWHIVSADGHPVDGSYVFWVGAGDNTAAGVPTALDAPAAWGPAIAGAPVIPVALRGIGVGLLMACAGLLTFVFWCGNAATRFTHRATRVSVWLALLATVFVALHLGAWMLNAAQQHTLTAESAQAILNSPVGRVELLRAVLVALTLWALWLARRAKLALFFAVCALIVSGASGHPGAITPAIAMPAKALHLLAGAAWVGGLIWLVMHDGGGSTRDESTFPRDARRVSTVALSAVILVALSGIVQTLLFLPAVLDLFRSTYGFVVLAKVAGLLVLIGFGADHRRRSLPRLQAASSSRAHFVSAIRAELAVMVLVIVLGGLLAYLPPPSGVKAPVVAASNVQSEQT